MKVSARFFFLGLISLLLVACGSAPTIKESKVMSTITDKTRNLQFIYRKVEMRLVSTTSYGSGGVSIANTGFDDFGPLLARQAEIVFAPYQVGVMSAKVIEGKEPIRIDVSQAGASTNAPAVLVVAPTSGKVSGNGRATSASYVFSALLINPDGRSTLWRATIDTSAWTGQDIVLKHMSKTLYDEAYATQLLTAIANQMKVDGVI